MSAKRSCLNVAALIVISLPAAGATIGPNAQEIVNKCKSVMTSVRTYQGTWQMSMSMGQMGAMAITMDMKSIPKSGKMFMKVTPFGTPSGMLAATGGSMNAQMTDDGKVLYKYDKNKNQYSKEAHIQNFRINPADIWFQMAGNSDFKIEKTVKLNGRPTYVLQALPKQGAGPGVPVSRVFIDQATYQLKQLTMTGSFAGGQGSQSQTMDMKLLVKHDQFNQPIPASTFKFTPPPGAKLVQTGKMPLMGGPMMGNPMGRMH